MNSRGWMAGVAMATLFGAAAASAQAEDTALVTALRQAVTGNFAAYDRKDVDGSMRFIDSKSPDYDSTKGALAALFKDVNNTRTEIVGFAYIGHDDEFAVARVKSKTTGKAESGFGNNVVDAIMIFHQENGQWKLWSEEILGVQVVP
jgi:hypothetical protein